MSPRERCDLPESQLVRAPVIQPDWNRLLLGIGAEAVPAPQFRRFHQTTLHYRSDRRRNPQVSNPTRPGPPATALRGNDPSTAVHSGNLDYLRSSILFP